MGLTTENLQALELSLCPWLIFVREEELVPSTYPESTRYLVIPLFAKVYFSL